MLIKVMMKSNTEQREEKSEELRWQLVAMEIWKN